MLPSGYNTYAGLIVSAIALIARTMGYEVAPQFSEEANALILLAFEIGGLVYGAYGRARATIPGWFAKAE